jgi:hypothetical protein
MRSIADAISEHGSTRPSMAQAFRDLRTAWDGNRPDMRVLRQAKAAVWAELKAKNGNSTAIIDATDRTLRAILWLADLVEPCDALNTAGWAAEMLSTELWPRQAKYC